MADADKSKEFYLRYTAVLCRHIGCLLPPWCSSPRCARLMLRGMRYLTSVYDGRVKGKRKRDRERERERERESVCVCGVCVCVCDVCDIRL
jgi:hypothetical protein